MTIRCTVCNDRRLEPLVMLTSMAKAFVSLRNNKSQVSLLREFSVLNVSTTSCSNTEICDGVALLGSPTKPTSRNDSKSTAAAHMSGSTSNVLLFTTSATKVEFNNPPSTRFWIFILKDVSNSSIVGARFSARIGQMQSFATSN